MTNGSSQGLFVVVAVIIFGIFVLISYVLFRDTLKPSLANIFTDGLEQAEKNINSGGNNAGDNGGYDLEELEQIKNDPNNVIETDGSITTIVSGKVKEVNIIGKYNKLSDKTVALVDISYDGGETWGMNLLEVKKYYEDKNIYFSADFERIDFLTPRPDGMRITEIGSDFSKNILTEADWNRANPDSKKSLFYGVMDVALPYTLERVGNFALHEARVSSLYLNNIKFLGAGEILGAEYMTDGYTFAEFNSKATKLEFIGARAFKHMEIPFSQRSDEDVKTSILKLIEVTEVGFEAFGNNDLYNVYAPKLENSKIGDKALGKNYGSSEFKLLKTLP